MLLVVVKGCVEIGGAVSGLKHRKEACVVDGVGVSNIHDLHVQFEAPTALVSSQLHPHLTGGYCAIMPSEAIRRSIKERWGEFQQE